MSATIAHDGNASTASAVSSSTLAVVGTAGNAMILTLGMGTKTRTLSSVTDSASNTGWVILFQNSSSTAGSAVIAWNPNLTSSITSVTLNFSGTTRVSMGYMDVSGLTGVVDGTPTGANNTVASLAPAQAFTTTNANDFIVATMGTTASGNSVTSIDTFAIETNAQASGGLILESPATVSETATGTYTCTWHLSVSAVNSTAIAAFKVTAPTNQTVSPPAATASASALTPAVQVKVSPSAATASASALVPVVTGGAANQTVSPPAATATTSSPVPVPKLEVDPPAATASASATVPTVSAGQTVFAPAATASASGLVPTIQARVTPGVASAAASASVPVAQLKVSPAAATAAASAVVPIPQLQLPPSLATASASAPIPTVSGGIANQTVSPPVAAASALARVPTVTGSQVVVTGWAIGGAWSSSWGFKPNAPEPSKPFDIYVPPQPAGPLR